MKILEVILGFLKALYDVISKLISKVTKSTSIRTKLIASFLVPIVFIIALGLVSYLKSSDAVSKVAKASTAATMDGTAKYLDAVFSNITNLTMQLMPTRVYRIT